MERIASFCVDHTTLEPGMYLSRRDGEVTTFDLRFKRPNCGDYISPKALHTIEHILATVLRNSEEKDNVIYFGPMGCRTGFYLLTVNLTYEQVLRLLQKSFRLAVTFTEIPGSKEEECGNYLEHDLAEALKEMNAYSEVLSAL